MRPTTAARVAATWALCLMASVNSWAQDRAEVGSTGSAWRSLLAQGRALPNWERLAVVDREGRVLRVVDGEKTRVLLPVDLHVALSRGELGATLVHNHVVDRGFSCADLRQLAKRGVTSVVAVGNDGSLFEAAAGVRFDPALLEEGVCDTWLGRVSDRLAREVGHGLGERSELADQVPHLFAAALFRLGVIAYRAVPAVRVRITHVRHAVTFERVVDTIADDLVRTTHQGDRPIGPRATLFGGGTPALSSPGQ